MRSIILASILLLAPWVNAQEIWIPKATVLTLMLDQELEAKKVKKGKGFKAHLSQPVRDDAGQEIIPAGSEVKGKVEETVGKATSDEEMQARGVADQLKGDSQRAG